MTRSALVLASALVLTAAVMFALSPQPVADAHCQVPCGIYDDPARIVQLKEDQATIAKAMAQMADLTGKGDAQSQQQFARWVTTKEDHATRIIDVVSEYFLTQKLKPVGGDAPERAAYLEKLAAHHAVMVAAMKCKQNADPQHAESLLNAIHGIEHIWTPAQ